MSSHTLKVAIIGFGFMGRTHADAYVKIPGTKLVAVGDTNPNGFRQWSAPYPVRYFENPSQLLKETDADILDICLPTFLHEEFVIRGAERGLHILCEKPLALSVAECDRMLTAVEKAGVTFMVAQVLRFFAHYQKIADLIQTSSIGSVIAASAARMSEPPQWAQWFRDPMKSGGALFDLQVHDLDYLLNLFGVPESLFATGVQDEGGCWNQVLTILSHRDKKIALESSYRMPAGWPFTTALRAIGSEGAIEYNISVRGNVDVVDQARHSLLLYRPGTDPQSFEISDPDPYLREIECFVSCVKQGIKPALIPPQQSRTVVAVLNAVRQSLESGHPVMTSQLAPGGFATLPQGGSTHAGNK